MIHEIKKSGKHHIGDRDDESLTIWACYYTNTDDNIIEASKEITMSPFNYAKATLPPNWFCVYSDTSREELIQELENNRGKEVV